MKVCLPILVMFLIMTDVALGAVGGGSVSDGTSSLQPVNGYSTGATGNANVGAAMPSAGPASGGNLAASVGAYVPIQSESYQSVSPENPSSMSGSYQDGYSQLQGNQPSQAAPNAQAVVSSAPQISGPYQEGMSADDLRLSQPQADSFRPDEALGFVSASLPSDLNPNLNTLDTGCQCCSLQPNLWCNAGHCSCFKLLVLSEFHTLSQQILRTDPFRPQNCGRMQLRRLSASLGGHKFGRQLLRL